MMKNNIEIKKNSVKISVTQMECTSCSQAFHNHSEYARYNISSQKSSNHWFSWFIFTETSPCKIDQIIWTLWFFGNRANIQNGIATDDVCVSLLMIWHYYITLPGTDTKGIFLPAVEENQDMKKMLTLYRCACLTDYILITSKNDTTSCDFD